MKEVIDYLKSLSTPEDFAGFFELDKLIIFEDGDIDHHAYLRTMTVFYSTQWGLSDFEQSPKYEKEEVCAGLFVCHENQLHIHIGLEKNFFNAEKLKKDFKLAILYPHTGNKRSKLLVDDGQHAHTLSCLNWDGICDYIFQAQPMFHFCSGLDQIGPHGESVSHLFENEVA